jgi:hypothetical protein
VKRKVSEVKSTDGMGCCEAEVMMCDVEGHTLGDAINRRVDGSW